MSDITKGRLEAHKMGAKSVVEHIEGIEMRLERLRVWDSGQTVYVTTLSELGRGNTK